MKKFSKITESNKFLGYSEDVILNEFKNHLNPKFIQVTTLYVTRSSQESEIVDDVGSVKIWEDKIFAPMFYIDLVLGDVSAESNFHETDSRQVDNWANESIKFDLIKDEFDKLSNFLEGYKEDFNISLEMSGGSGVNRRDRANAFITNSKGSQKLNILSITISLIMKDYFEYDQIK